MKTILLSIVLSKRIIELSWFGFGGGGEENGGGGLGE